TRLTAISARLVAVPQPERPPPPIRFRNDERPASRRRDFSVEAVWLTTVLTGTAIANGVTRTTAGHLDGGGTAAIHASNEATMTAAAKTEAFSSAWATSSGHGS